MEKINRINSHYRLVFLQKSFIFMISGEKVKTADCGYPPYKIRRGKTYEESVL